MLDRTATTGDQVGVSVNQANGYYFLRLLLRRPHLKRLDNCRQLTIRGQPANGFIITPDRDSGLKLRSVSPTSGAFYLQTTITKFELSKQPRKLVYLRPAYEGNQMRLPALPPAWIDCAPEFTPSGREVVLPTNPLDEAVEVRGNGSPTAPLPKPVPTYQVPAGVDMVALQAQLAEKLDAARVFIRSLEASTGLRFMLDRNLRLTVVLTS
jgi:hypothetical protein